MSKRMATMPAPPAGSAPAGPLGLGRGIALYIGAVLGPGVLALPQLAAAAAGPASVTAWAGLLLLSVPVALTFAALAARYPDAGGVATFARHAFGPKASAVVGWWFYAVIPVGAPAAAVIGSQYVAGALGLGQAGSTLVSVLVLVVAFGANYVGLRLSGGTQLLLMVVLLALLAVSIAAAAVHIEPENFTPFAPHGFSGIMSAVAVLFFAFAGWEAATHLSGEFADPARQLRRVTVIALTIVAIVYLSLSTMTIAVLGESAAVTPIPLTLLLERGLGSVAYPIAAAIAVVLTLATAITFIAGASRLGASLAANGAMPAAIAKGGTPGRTPRRSITVLVVVSALTTGATALWNIDLDSLMRATSACLAAVTVVGLAAGIRLLPGTYAKGAAAVATGFTGLVVLWLGWYLLVPLAVAFAALGYLAVRRA